MNKIIFDATILKYMSLFFGITHVQPRDCINDESGAVFIVPAGETGKAVGSGGTHIRKVEKIINKKVRVVAYDDNLVGFIENLMYPARIKEIREEDHVVSVTALDNESRGHIIGRNATNLRRLEAIAKRYFPLQEIKVK